MQINESGLAFRGEAPSAGEQRTPDAIVLHHRAGSGDMASLHALHLARGWWGVGYHYYVRRDGSVWRGRAEKWAGAHAGAASGYNMHSIGICFEGNFENEAMPDIQREAGEMLVRDIASRLAIREVLLHRDLAATACPGKNFPASIAAALQSADYSAAAVNWAVERGILRGTPAGDLMLDRPLTRRDAAVMLHRALCRGEVM